MKEVDLVFFGVAFLGLVIASYSDLKTREVPDWLNYGLIFSGLSLRLAFSFIGEWEIFFSGVLGLVVFVTIAYLLYYGGQWGGGDAKLLMGLGAVLGLPLGLSLNVFSVSFFVNLLLVGGLYGLVWVVVIALIKRKKFLGEFVRLSNKAGKVKLVLIIFSLLLVPMLFFIDGKMRAFYGFFLLFPLGVFYLWLIVKSVENISFYKEVEPEQLTEGDWVVNRIIVKGEEICGPKDLGVSKEQIEKLRKLKKEGNVDDILIKIGIPFVPSFLIAFVVTLLVGNVFLLLV